MTADALYTITRLAQTSTSVAVNNHLSDLSFRAMRSTVQVRSDRHIPGRTSDQQSSAGRRGKTPTSRTGAARVPSGQLFSASTGLMTAHRSSSLRVRQKPLVAQLHHLLLEHPSALGIVLEHVEARTRRR